MEFKSAPRQSSIDTSKGFTTAEASFNTGTTVSAEVHRKLDGNSTVTLIRFHSDSDQDARVHVHDGRLLELEVEGQWEADALAKAMQFVAMKVLHSDQPQVTFDQARAFMEALCGWEDPSGSRSKAKSPAAMTHLGAVLGQGRLPVVRGAQGPRRDPRVGPAETIDEAQRTRNEEEAAAKPLALYLIAVGQALLAGYDQEREEERNANL